MFKLFFDGCSKGNPGKCGAGAVIYKDDQEVWSDSKFVGINTNNYAEYSGLLLGLEKAIDMGITELDVYGDSMLVIRQMKGEYKVNSPNIKPIYDKTKEVSRKFQKISFKHVYRVKNARADELSNEAI